MKIKFWFFLGTMFLYGQLNAAQFYSLQYNKKGKNFSNEVAELNQADGSILSTIQLSSSYKYGMERLTLPESQRMFFYGLIDKKKAKIQIVNKLDLSDIKTITIDHIHNRLLTQYQVYKFYQLTEDQRHLLIHTGFKKNQSLTVIDVESGAVLRKVPMSRYKNEVSVSSDQAYITLNNTSRDELTLVRTSDFNVAMTSTLGEARQFGIIHDDFLYLTKFKGKNRAKTFWVQALNLKTKEKTDLITASSEQPIFAVNSKTGQLLSVRTDKSGKQLILQQFNGNTTSDIGTFDIKMIPQKMYIDDVFDQLLVMGKGKISNIDLNNVSLYAQTKLPFDTANYLYNKSGNLLYLKEGTGSEVAVVDVKSGELIERSGTGRQGVKFGQFMASVALAGVTAGTGYMYIVVKYSSTGMAINHNQDKLYVINSKTNDVTHFSANNLSDRKAIATGGGTFLVHQGSAADAPLWVFSNKQISQINDQSFELEKAIEYETIVGLELAIDQFIIKTEDNILTYDMKTGNITNQWPMSGVDLIWSEK